MRVTALAVVTWFSLSPARADPNLWTFEPAIEAAHPVLGTRWGGWTNGGPVVTLRIPTHGGTPYWEPRFGVAYEIARPDWLIYSAGVEYRPGAMTLDPGVMFASPMLPFGADAPPALGLGLGVSAPIELGAATDVGIRCRILFFLGGVVGFGNDLEWFPGSREQFRHSLVVRASL